jgi:alkaline phosphatase D
VQSTTRSLKQNSIGRRAFLRATLVTVGAAAVGCGGDGGADPGPLQDGAEYFPQSVASGDPRDTSVIVWTRLVDPDLGDEDAEVALEVATDAEFLELVEVEGDASAAVPARAQFDRCVKAKLRGLSPATTYYYRFVHTRADGRFASPVGRTKTAPAPDSDAKVRFAFVSCQDYNGRYYNAYAHLLAQEVDFVVHLGDYVYETTGDPRFQTTEGRVVQFADPAGAIVFNEGSDEQYYAAKSLDNYRELYRVYRSDPALRKVHETLPMICTWDDHEFSDDCHGDVATYFGGRVDEQDPDRRRAANQAWFEYMPVDFRDEGFEYDPSAAVPGDIEIFRDFSFGKHLRLVMTDLRSHRSDHLIAEDAFPGAVVLDQAALAQLGELPEAAAPYVDIDAYDGGSYKDALVAAAADLDIDPAKITGKLDVGYVNDLLARAGDPLAAITEVADLELGLAYRHLGKQSAYASIGARYLVNKDNFDVWAGVRYREDPASQEAMGAAQQQWFLDTMKGAKETWKVWGNEYCLMPLVIDLRALPIDPFNQRFYMNVDQWDGMRDRRDELLAQLAGVGNVVAITGDIHAFYAGNPTVDGDPDRRIVELVTGSISSGTFRSLLVSQVESDPVLSNTPGAAGLADAIDTLFRQSGVNPHLAHADSSHHGFATVELDGAELVATYHVLAEADVLADLSDLPAAELAAKFTTVRFKVEAGKPDLFKEDDGQWQRWDPAQGAYV